MDYNKLLFSFEGRINRQPYWMYFLAMTVVSILAVVIAGVLGDKLGLIILIPLIIVLTWSGLAVQVKRWHDRDKSAWWLLMNLVPIIGALWVLVECGFLRGTEGQNQFGPDPLAGS